LELLVEVLWQWSSVNPHLVYEVSLHDVKVGMWCALGAKQIIGLIFYAETNNSDRL
jgi:hypothetical protein